MELPAELEAAIRAAPDDRDGYLVAADWLSSQGDPHGELIALSLAPQSDDVGARITQLQRQLEPVDTSGTWNPIAIEWRWGFVVGVACWSLRGREEPELLRTILRAPVARFLRKLVLVGVASEKFVAALADEPAALASLRTLVVETEDDVAFDIAPIWRFAADLEQLVLHVGRPLGPIALPKLRELSLFGPQAGLFDRSELPALETCRLRVPEGDEPIVREQLRRRDLASRMPALRRLTVAGPELGDVDSWRGTALAQRLELFDLMDLRRGFETTRRFVVDVDTPAPAALVMMSGTHRIPPGTLVPLPERPMFRVGRRSSMDLALGHPTIAKGHARVHHDAGRWEVRDHSTNGSTVNRFRVATCPLRPGDELAFAAVEFRFVAGDIEAQANELRARFGLGV